MIKNTTVVDEKMLKHLNNIVFRRILTKFLICDIIFLPLVIASFFLDHTVFITCCICGAIIVGCNLLFVVLYFVTNNKQKKFALQSFTYEYDFNTDDFVVTITQNGLQRKVTEQYLAFRRVFENKEVIFLERAQNRYYPISKLSMSEADIIMLKSILRAKIKGRLK